MSNPYTPGYDRVPPVFAGRERETDILDRMAESLESGAYGDRDLIVYGPRGNGKTALLSFTHKRLKERSKVRSIIVDPSDVPTPVEVYEILLETPRPTERTITTEGDARAEFLGTGAIARRSTSQVFESTIADLKKRCIDLMTKKPTILLVDEGHEITGDSLRAILSLSRASNREETNFRFVLSGTPDLPSHLRRIGPMYLNRARRLRLERLDIESATTALFQPMENAGYDVELDGAERERLIERTQCYPHFIQSIGHAIWDVAEAQGNRRVDMGSLVDAKPLWEEEINTMYEDRFQELDSKDLVPYATAVAAAFAGPTSVHNGYIDVHDIRKVVKGVSADAPAHEVVNELSSLGYVWPARGAGHLYEPGIPSLMDHMLGIARDREIPSLQKSIDDKFDLEGQYVGRNSPHSEPIGAAIPSGLSSS